MKQQTYIDHAHKLYAVLTRMAQIRNCSATCGLKDCRRARRCVGTERRCVWRLPDRPFTLARDDVAEWRELVRSRQQCLAAIEVAAIVGQPSAK